MGVLAHLVLVPAWVTPPFLLTGGLLKVGSAHGALGVLGTMVLGPMLVASESMASRGPLCAVLVAMGAAAPGGGALAATGAALLTSLLACMCRGGMGDFSRRPGLRRFLADWLPHFYQRAGLHGALGTIRKNKSCFGFHPHGCLTAGFTVNGCYSDKFHAAAGKVNWLCDYNLRYKNPFFRVKCDAVRTEESEILAADRASFLGVMAKGENFAFLPGGFHDAVAAEFGKDRVVMRQRKGFVKYCLQHGYRLHPVYTFGESETFHTFTGLQGLRMRLANRNIPAIAFVGWPLLPCLPRPQSRILSYVGAPVELPQIAEPSKDDIDKWHAEYLQALTAVFEANKAEAGFPDAVLEIL